MERSLQQPEAGRIFPRLIQVYEILGKTVDREVVSQYIQHRMIAKDFASYLALYYKYRTDYKVEDILKGKWDSITLGKIRTASLMSI